MTTTPQLAATAAVLAWLVPWVVGMVWLYDFGMRVGLRLIDYIAARFTP